MTKSTMTAKDLRDKIVPLVIKWALTAVLAIAILVAAYKLL